MDKSTAYNFTLAEGHRFSGARDGTGFGHLHSFDDEPCVIYADGTKWWYERGAVSRQDDKPAVVWWNGVEEWWVDGVRHRDGNPAVIFPDNAGVHPQFRGVRQFWNHGVLVRQEKR